MLNLALKIGYNCLEIGYKNLLFLKCFCKDKPKTNYIQ